MWKHFLVRGKLPTGANAFAWRGPLRRAIIAVSLSQAILGMVLSTVEHISETTMPHSPGGRLSVALIVIPGLLGLAGQACRPLRWPASIIHGLIALVFLPSAAASLSVIVAIPQILAEEGWDAVVRFWSESAASMLLCLANFCACAFTVLSLARLNKLPESPA